MWSSNTSLGQLLSCMGSTWKQSPMPSAGLPQEVAPHMPPSSQIQWDCYKKWKRGTRGPDWNVSMVDTLLRKHLWLCCPGHAGVMGNDRADRLADKATLVSGLLLGRSEVLRSLRHYLQAQSQGHHTIDRLKERGVERGSARRSSLKGRESRAIVNQPNIGTASKATFGKLLRDGVERRIWDFLSA